eukprot:5806235-Amphidinium_carterae.1
MDGLSMEEVTKSAVLIDRGLWEGQWLKLNTTDFDFMVKLSSHGACSQQCIGEVNSRRSPKLGFLC